MTHSSYQSIIGKGTPKKLFISFGLVTLVFVILFLVILPYKFYKRDVNDSRNYAQSISKLIRAAVLSHMVENVDHQHRGQGNHVDQDPNSMRVLLTTFQTEFKFEFRLIRSNNIEKQHNINEDSQSKDELIKDVFRSGRGREDWPGSTRFRYVSPFVADESCKKCHQGMNDQNIEIGSVLGVSEIIFELKDKRNTSIRQIIEITLLMIAGLLTLGFILFFIVKKGILDPMGIE